MPGASTRVRDTEGEGEKDGKKKKERGEKREHKVESREETTGATRKAKY